MLRQIVAFEQDDAGDWVAHLSCLHRQHVRHNPPFRDRLWVTTEDGRAEHLGTDLDCPLCDRAELPPDLEVARVASFDDTTFPAGLRRDHRLASATWAVLEVLEGKVHLTIATDPPLDRSLREGDTQPIPPEVAHAANPAPGTIVSLTFLRREQGVDTVRPGGRGGTYRPLSGR